MAAKKFEVFFVTVAPQSTANNVVMSHHLGLNYNKSLPAAKGHIKYWYYIINIMPLATAQLGNCGPQSSSVGQCT